MRNSENTKEKDAVASAVNAIVMFECDLCSKKLSKEDYYDYDYLGYKGEHCTGTLCEDCYEEPTKPNINWDKIDDLMNGLST